MNLRGAIKGEALGFEDQATMALDKLNATFGDEELENTDRIL